MKCLAIQCENVKRGPIASIITTDVQNSITLHEKHHLHLSVASSIDNCLLYARPDRTHTTLQLFFQMF